jgi:hypothetical protein
MSELVAGQVPMNDSEVSREAHGRVARRVSFDTRGDTHYDVTPYSETYGVDPSELLFHKHDKEPSWSFIADPDAEDVDDLDLESDSDDEDEQPVLTRRGFRKPMSLRVCIPDQEDDMKSTGELQMSPVSTAASEGFRSDSSDVSDEEEPPHSPTDVEMWEEKTQAHRRAASEHRQEVLCTGCFTVPMSILWKRFSVEN